MSLHRFSVIIPTYNRRVQLTECLMAIRSQGFPKDAVEIIVVDDGSRVPVEERIRRHEELGKIRCVRVPNSGPAAARNWGSKASRGEYLVFIDDDCIPSPDWLANVDQCATLHPDCLIGGRTMNRLFHNPHATTSQLIVDAVYRFYNADPISARFLATNNMTVRADLFAHVGGFHEGFRIASEDREFCDRWLHQKRQIVFCREIVIFHDHLLDFASFCRQHFNYGRGAYQYHYLRHERGSGSIKADMKFYTTLDTLLRPSLMKLKRTMATKVCVLLAVWQIMNLIGFLVQGSKFRH